MLAHQVRIQNLVRKAVNPVERTIDAKYDKPKEKKVIDPEADLRKEIRESVGKINPLIVVGVEDSLAKTKYRRKTKFEAVDDVCDNLEKKIRELQEKRFSNIPVKHFIYKEYL